MQRFGNVGVSRLGSRDGPMSRWRGRPPDSSREWAAAEILGSAQRPGAGPLDACDRRRTGQELGAGRFDSCDRKRTHLLLRRLESCLEPVELLGQRME